MKRLAWAALALAAFALAATILLRGRGTSPGPVSSAAAAPKTAHAEPLAEQGDSLGLAHLRAAGDDLSKARPVDFYLYFPVDDGAHAAEQRLPAYGFSTALRAPAEEGAPWLVVATRTLTPSLETLGAARNDLTALAGQLGGDYDGWESHAPE